MTPHRMAACCDLLGIRPLVMAGWAMPGLRQRAAFGPFFKSSEAGRVVGVWGLNTAPTGVPMREAK